MSDAKAHDKIVTGPALQKESKVRNKSFQEENIPHSDLPEYESKGWAAHKVYKRHTRVRRMLTGSHAFEDYVWTLFYKMGFTHLNKGRHFKLPYNRDETLTQQVDVFAMDGECVIVVECKSADNPGTRSNFKTEVEAIGGRKQGINAWLRNQFGVNQHKIKYIFATRNYIVSEPDRDRLREFHIDHLSEENIDYFNQLTKHLGTAAKYQLLGTIFPGQEVPNMAGRVPAIQGKMGGHKYYVFSCEPDILLKIGYVLHRNSALKEFMPTYQRLIKKARLQSIEKYLKRGGYFPNSVIISFHTEKRLRFEPVEKKESDSSTVLGILNIPKRYRSAYIIDGQHRIYGYTNIKYRDTNTIPVVAFENLSKQEQIRIFMDINENQKAVPTNLRSTLRADLLWDSESKEHQVKAMHSRIAQDLGERRNSPLFDRVIVGENTKSKQRCVTIPTIEGAMRKSTLTSRYSDGQLVASGLFDVESRDKTFERVLDYLMGVLNIVARECKTEWEKGDAVDGCLSTNGGIWSLMMLINDICVHLQEKSGLNLKVQSIESLIEHSERFLQPVIHHMNTITSDERMAFKRLYGEAGRIKYWRKLQGIVASKVKDFSPHGLEEYERDQEKVYNEQAFKMIRDIETFLNSDFKEKLLSHFGGDWLKQGLPEKTYMEVSSRMAHKNFVDKSGRKYEMWDCLLMIDYRRIATHNWAELFEASYTMPGQEKKRGGKEGKTEWMQKLNDIRNQNFHEYVVTEEDYNFLSAVHSWLMKEED
jgi:DNA sulfur modification protein DndB